MFLSLLELLLHAGYLGKWEVVQAYSGGGETGLPCLSIQEQVCLICHGAPPPGGLGKVGERTVMLSFRQDFNIWKVEINIDIMRHSE